jgi:hypothetical protein
VINRYLDCGDVSSDLLLEVSLLLNNHQHYLCYAVEDLVGKVSNSSDLAPLKNLNTTLILKP